MLGLAIVRSSWRYLLAPLVANHDPFQTSFTTIRKAPSAQYWLGTDELGRDIFSRMVYGARASLMAGLVSVLIALAVACRSAWPPAISAAGPTVASRAPPRRCWPFPS